MLEKDATKLERGDAMSKLETSKYLLKELEDAANQIEVHQMQENPNFSEEGMRYIEHNHGEADLMDPQLGEKEEQKVASTNDEES